MILSALISAAALLHAASASPAPPVSEAFPKGESLVYTLKFIDTTAGECVMETLPETTWEGHAVRHFRASIKTSGLIGLIYPYTETIDLYSDREHLNPLFVDINIHDRKKAQHTQIRLDETTLHGEEIEDSTEPGEAPHHRIKGWTMSPGAQSLFSILYFMRTQPLTPGGQVTFPVSHDEKNAEFVGEIVRSETVQTGKGERDAYLVRVSRSFANVFYSSIREEPELWFSADKSHVPLRFELKHRMGRVFAILRNPP